MKKSRKAHSKPETSRKRRTAFAVRLEGNLLQTLLVSFDHLLDHLATHGACLTGGQVTVVTVLQVHANFLSSLHLEAIHSFACLGNIDLIVVLHGSLSFSVARNADPGNLRFP